MTRCRTSIYPPAAFGENWEPRLPAKFGHSRIELSYAKMIDALYEIIEMPRIVLLLIAALLATSVLAQWVAIAERDSRVADSGSHEPFEDSAQVAGASADPSPRTAKIADSNLCFSSNNRLTMILYIHTAVMTKPIHGDCKVTRTGGGEYEIESSFLVGDNPTPIRYTGLGNILAESSSDDGTYIIPSLKKIKLHGFHDDFVSIRSFRRKRLKRPPCTAERSRLSSELCYP